MADAAGWFALAATCIAALMTAANLGARVTGWGFVVFTFGAVGWAVVGWVQHEQQLLYSNVFLGIVDVFGVWRWLHHRVRIADTAEAEERSSAKAGEKLFSLGKLDGMEVLSASGEAIAHAVDALARCRDGRIDFMIIRVGGVGGLGETLHRLPWADATIGDGVIRTALGPDSIARLPAAHEPA